MVERRPEYHAGFYGRDVTCEMLHDLFYRYGVARTVPGCIEEFGPKGPKNRRVTLAGLISWHLLLYLAMIYLASSTPHFSGRKNR